MDVPMHVPLSTPEFRAPEWNGPCVSRRSKKSKSKSKSHSKKHKKHSKKHSKKCCKKGCPGKPGPIAQVVGFGAVRPSDGDTPIEPFFLLLNGNGASSPGLDAASNLTSAVYAYEALETTTKVNISASIDAPAGTQIQLTLHVAEAALPPVNTTALTVSVIAPFTVLTNQNFGVAQGWIVWVEAATLGGTPNPDFNGLTVELELNQPQ
jgi:hypothetical protein